MFRGTTPTIEIEFDFDTSLIDCLYITFVQKQTKVFEKCISDCSCSGNIAKLILTQTETLKLQGNGTAYFQVRCKLIDGTVFADKPRKFEVEDIFKEGEI